MIIYTFICFLCTYCIYGYMPYIGTYAYFNPYVTMWNNCNVCIVFRISFKFNKYASVQLKVRRRSAPIHYLNQCWRMQFIHAVLCHYIPGENELRQIYVQIKNSTRPHLVPTIIKLGSTYIRHWSDAKFSYRCLTLHSHLILNLRYSSGIFVFETKCIQLIEKQSVPKVSPYGSYPSLWVILQIGVIKRSVSIVLLAYHD